MEWSPTTSQFCRKNLRQCCNHWTVSMSHHLCDNAMSANAVHFLSSTSVFEKKKKKSKKKELLENNNCNFHMADNNIIKMACSLLQVQNSLRVKFIDTNNNPTILLQKVLVSQDCCFNPSTPMRDQDRISPYNINTISSRQAMRIKKNINLGITCRSHIKFS